MWIKEMCQKYGIQPLRRRGQNFLVNKRVLERILQVAELKKNDIILEIGAGFGTLTIELAKRVKKVMAVEIDRKLVEILRENLRDYKNVEIVQGDILKIKIPNLKSQNYKIVANLPYNITGAVLRKFLSERLEPKLMVLMVQKEVAEKICARPGKMGLLSVIVQFYGQPKMVQIVSKNNFWPRPKVDSALLKISQIGKNLPPINAKLFFQLVRLGFSNPRKQLANNLAKIINKEKIKKIFRKINLNEKVRAQNLSIAEWQALFKELLKKREA